MKSRFCLAVALVLALALSFLPAAAAAAEKSKAKPQAAQTKKPVKIKKAQSLVKTVVEPVVVLDRFEVQNYFGYWMDGKADPAEKRGAPIVIAFVFNVLNPNSIPVCLQSLKFTYTFENYEINTLSYDNPMWIPPAKTNQVRVVSAISAYTTLLNLLVTSGFQMKAQGVKAPDLLQRWWTDLPDYKFPVYLKNGTASFDSEAGSVLTTFVAKFGGK